MAANTPGISLCTLAAAPVDAAALADADVLLALALLEDAALALALELAAELLAAALPVDAAANRELSEYMSDGCGSIAVFLGMSHLVADPEALDANASAASSLKSWPPVTPDGAEPLLAL